MHVRDPGSKQRKADLLLEGNGLTPAERGKDVIVRASLERDGEKHRNTHA